MRTEKDLNYWKANAEEDYKQVPISVLRYISELEEQVNKNSVLGDVIKQRELLKSFCEYTGIADMSNVNDVYVDIENHIKRFNSL